MDEKFYEYVCDLVDFDVQVYLYPLSEDVDIETAVEAVKDKLST